MNDETPSEILSRGYSYTNTSRELKKENSDTIPDYAIAIISFLVLATAIVALVVGIPQITDNLPLKEGMTALTGIGIAASGILATVFTVKSIKQAVQENHIDAAAANAQSANMAAQLSASHSKTLENIIENDITEEQLEKLGISKEDLKRRLISKFGQQFKAYWSGIGDIEEATAKVRKAVIKEVENMIQEQNQIQGAFDKMTNKYQKALVTIQSKYAKNEITKEVRDRELDTLKIDIIGLLSVEAESEKASSTEENDKDVIDKIKYSEKKNNDKSQKTMNHSTIFSLVNLAQRAEDAKKGK